MSAQSSLVRERSATQKDPKWEKEGAWGTKIFETRQKEEVEGAWTVSS
jgi:hypothetical protein